ncbi:ABC transporter ATP-binding protein [Pseudorhodoplanes sp.]|uniref:ABC transporter ATP-binding protein n=1 Tax=Pseudorhodoplanes sp. TaxID=1934341 RepID=UPI003D0B0619
MGELEIEAITLRFGGMAVLNAVSLSVRAGELLALIGPNGAGKTSIFNCISGIYKPEGTIRFRGEEICGWPPHQIAASGVGRTFQHAELFDEMSVLDNVMTGLHTRLKPSALANMVRWPSSQRAERKCRIVAEEILDFLELQHLANQAVGNLPFGVHKLVGFGRALAAKPSLLLLDEPSAGLTREERENLAFYIMKAKQSMDMAIIWIEHDMQMVADLADRIHVLDYGRSLADGAPEDVLRDEEVIRAYLGSAEVVAF